MRGFRLGIFRKRLSKGLPIDKHIVFISGPHGLDPLRNAYLDFLRGPIVKQKVQEFALHRVGKLRPIPTHRLHSDYLHFLALRIYPEARRIPSRVRAPPRFGELELQMADHAELGFYVASKRLVARFTQFPARFFGLLRFDCVRHSRIHKQGVDITVQNLVALLLQEIFGPAEEMLPEPGDGTGQLTGGKAAGAQRAGGSCEVGFRGFDIRAGRWRS